MPSVQFGRSTIDFVIRAVKRKTLAIHVFPEGNVVVDSPVNTPLNKVESKVLKRAPWILKQQRLFASYPPAIPSRQYVSGESFRYLGRQYRLRTVIGKDRSAKLRGAFLKVEMLGQDDAEKVKELMDAWLREKAKRVFTELLEKCSNAAQAIGVKETPPLRILRMKKRWGSCTKNGVVILNLELVSAPKDCIEYLIYHELCHLRVRNHTPSFYRLLSRLCPNWEMLRHKLNQIVELHLEY